MALTLDFIYRIRDAVKEFLHCVDVLWLGEVFGPFTNESERFLSHV
jgi:hypothetical protein